MSHFVSFSVKYCYGYCLVGELMSFSEFMAIAFFSLVVAGYFLIQFCPFVFPAFMFSVLGATIYILINMFDEVIQ